MASREKFANPIFLVFGRENPIHTDDESSAGTRENERDDDNDESLFIALWDIISSSAKTIHR